MTFFKEAIPPILGSSGFYIKSIQIAMHKTYNSPALLALQNS